MLLPFEYYSFLLLLSKQLCQCYQLQYKVHIQPLIQHKNPIRALLP